MKRIRTSLNVILGSLIAALGVTGCEQPMVKYGVLVPEYGCPVVDTTVHCMYGVDPSPIIPGNEEDDEE